MIIDLASPAIQKWQENNRRLLAAGWELETLYMLDGTIEVWAVKGENRVRNDPPKDDLEKEVG